MRVGKGRQMTFLPGSGRQAEKSLRRATGITTDDEARVREAVMYMTVYPGLKSKPRLNKLKSFRFGASLREWTAVLKSNDGNGSQQIRLDSSQYPGGGVKGEVFRLLGPKK